MTQSPEPIPGWAKERAVQLGYEESERGLEGPWLTNAFARYIAAHEEEPVDPLLIEAREIAASAIEDSPTEYSRYSPERYRAGERDDEPGMKAIINALRRGIELGRANK